MYIYGVSFFKKGISFRMKWFKLYGNFCVKVKVFGGKWVSLSSIPHTLITTTCPHFSFLSLSLSWFYYLWIKLNLLCEWGFILLGTRCCIMVLIIHLVNRFDLFCNDHSNRFHSARSLIAQKHILFAVFAIWILLLSTTCCDSFIYPSFTTVNFGPHGHSALQKLILGMWLMVHFLWIWRSHVRHSTGRVLVFISGVIHTPFFIKSGVIIILPRIAKREPIFVCPTVCLRVPQILPLRRLEIQLGK